MWASFLFSSNLGRRKIPFGWACFVAFCLGDWGFGLILWRIGSMHVVWVGMIRPFLAILSYASKENFSHSPFFSGSMRSSSVFGCTFKVYTSQLYLGSFMSNLSSSGSAT